MECHKCGSTAITYYRQVISNGKTVVTARCQNGHHPIKGKPFYPLAMFNVESLPLLKQEEKAYQPALIEREITQNIDEFMTLDIVEQRRQIFERLKRDYPRLK